MAQATNQLHVLVDGVVSALGYELVGVEYLPQGQQALLRVYIDAEAGIGVDDCERVSRQLSAVLDVEDPVRGHYTLEVSSPGLDRPLFTAEQFSRFAGHQVQIRLKSARDGRRRFKGWLRGMDGDSVIVEVDDEELALPLSDIEKAHVVPEW